MNHDERFATLWNDYLEGDLNESDTQELRELLGAHDSLLQIAADSFQTHRLLGLISQDTPAQHEAFVQETLAFLPASDDRFVDGVIQRLPNGPGHNGGAFGHAFFSWSNAIAAAAVLALIASVLFVLSTMRPGVVRITQLNGSVQWTGNGGQVVEDLSVNQSLRGGTFETLSDDSWAELEFRDGSTVTVSGRTMLTVSAPKGQPKKLRLREGTLSASVMPQPEGQPMLIRTPTASMAVLGTQLNVNAEPTSTVLTVNEGKVRATRLADGSVTDVPADHRVVASIDQLNSFQAIRRQGAVHTWRSKLPTDATHGSWQSSPQRLQATPFLHHLNNKKKPVTLYLTALSVTRGQSRPVVLKHGAQLRVRGRIQTASDVTFGLTIHHPNGGFAGKYIAKHESDTLLKQDQTLDIVLNLEDFQPLEANSPRSPIGLELVNYWCFTTIPNAGLSITSVELLSDEN